MFRNHVFVQYKSSCCLKVRVYRCNLIFRSGQLKANNKHLILILEVGLLKCHINQFLFAHGPLPSLASLWNTSSSCAVFICLTLRWLMSYIYTEHLFLMFLDHTQRRSTVGRTPLDEWAARRRDLYLTTHNTHDRQTSMPSVEFEPTISAGERPQTYILQYYKY